MLNTDNSCDSKKKGVTLMDILCESGNTGCNFSANSLSGFNQGGSTTTKNPDPVSADSSIRVIPLTKLASEGMLMTRPSAFKSRTMTTTFTDGRRQVRALKHQKLINQKKGGGLPHRSRTGAENPLLRVMSLTDIFDAYEANSRRIEEGGLSTSSPLGEIDLNCQR